LCAAQKLAHHRSGVKVRESLVERTAGLMAKAKAEGKLTTRQEAGDWFHANSKILGMEERNLVVDRVFGKSVNPTKLHRKELAEPGTEVP
jgi:hypothetical protein